MFSTFNVYEWQAPFALFLCSITEKDTIFYEKEGRAGRWKIY
ncbi:hypothetical protein BSBH6_02633 [Bacillus subtilis]|uniref:Uncharacterized protein n=1 Tax=Bacillus inaquosorum KCTC 13429 TaxID=1236548 RepID=A0A9W5LML0_9BACI|nr:hypothetical protein BSI_08520 [Bacillus inaquosorum KCTC 13429]RPK03163.1 hypothetical protein BSBH6_02633 [Bacillus subtilis]RPK23603.1 hypothetical protein BH5_02630 [Bacillus subtilis]